MPVEVVLPQPACYRKEVKDAATGRFLRYAYYPKPPGVPMFTEGQVRALLERVK